MSTSSIKVTIQGKSYPLRVEEGGEEFMHQIAAFVDERLRMFKKELSVHSEQTIMVLACLSIAEELMILRTKKMQSGESEEISNKSEVEMADISVRLQKLLGDIKSGISHI
jgi:cell division protein ZapA (FtsZ GTPase activity inhibitor)